MRIETRIFSRGLPGEKRLLILIPESEEESKIIDATLGDKVPVSIKGTVALADGYGEHYISLEADK